MAGPIDLALGLQSHDLIIENYDLKVIDGAEQVAQHCKIRLLSLLGEWFLDNTIGVPWLEQILVKNPRGRLVAAALKAAIRGTPGVRRLTGFTFNDYDLGDRTIAVRFTADSDYGQVIADQLELNI